MYANVLKTNFQDLPPALQTEFQKFTQNLMQEEHISRDLLLNAINDFYKVNFHLCDTTYKWTSFTDNAWNYRPYQGLL